MLTASAGTVRWVGENITESRVNANGEHYTTIVGDITLSTGDSKHIAEYEFLGAWQANRLTVTDPYKTTKYFNYELTLDLPYEIPNVKDPVVYKVIVTSMDTEFPPALVDKTVQRIKVMYDCFAKGSLVLTPSGEVLVENLKQGDTVFVSGGTAVIHDVVKTLESPLVTIKTERHSITVTPEHMLLTVQGMKNADKIQTGDKLMTQGGEVVVTAVSAGKGEAYTLITNAPSDAYLTVNGLFTGI
jgi:preprotein translocase subunit YajC